MNVGEVLRFMPDSFSKHWLLASPVLPPPLSAEFLPGQQGREARLACTHVHCPSLSLALSFSPALPPSGGRCPLICSGEG